jgi:hypothetical protein
LLRLYISLVLVLALGGSLAHARGSVYVLSLEWPAVGEMGFALDVFDDRGGRSGITLTPAIRFEAVMRQSAIVIPDMTVCSGARQLWMRIAIPAGGNGRLSLTRDRLTLGTQIVESSWDVHLADLDGIDCAWRGDGILGELTIAVDKPEGNSFLEDTGHAWIEFRALSAEAPLTFVTLGTYSALLLNGTSGGLNVNREANRRPDAFKTVQLSTVALTRAAAVVSRYQAKGVDAWTIWNNCTAFVSDVWQAATGESLSTTFSYPGAPWEVTQLGLPNTGSLYYSLLSLGGMKIDED